MAWECSSETMQRMVALLKKNGILKDVRAEQAMLNVDRSHYCPSEQPYMDAPYSIGYGATISAPHMHAYALEALKDNLVDGAKALDVGSGSGYLTACMAHMVGPNGIVYGVEHIKELADMSDRNIRKGSGEFLESGRVKIIHADGRNGLEQFGPYDVIHVGATATDGLPEKLVEQLKEGGRMVLPIQRGSNQVFESIDKLPGGEIKLTPLLRVRYVPLTDAQSQLGKPQ